MRSVPRIERGFTLAEMTVVAIILAIHLLVRGFYALKDTWTPIFISVPGLGGIWLLSVLFIPMLGLNALGVAYAAVMTTEALLLLVLLRRKIARMHVG